MSVYCEGNIQKGEVTEISSLGENLRKVIGKKECEPRNDLRDKHFGQRG